jgi:hypothetical protein
MFQKATREQAKLRLALEGPAGYGKTETALRVATVLAEAEGKRVAFVDTEHGSASLYSDRFDFDVVNLSPPFHPDRFVEAIAAAEGAGYGVVVLDSLSHAWAGDGGLLTIVDTVARTKYKGDTHRAWKDAGEIQQRLTDSILRSGLHVIAAMRTKKDYVREEVGGKTKIRAAGTKTIQRDEFDYEFTIVGRFDVPVVLSIVKSRCAALPPETVIDKPGDDFAETLRSWLAEGESTDPTDEQKKRLDSAMKAGAKSDPDRFSIEKVESLAVTMTGRALDALTKHDYERVVAKIESAAMAAVSKAASEGEAEKGEA